MRRQLTAFTRAVCGLLGWSACTLAAGTSPRVAAAPSSASAADRPSFILYITDDISWDDLGCYGSPVVKTPHLDRMATEGRVFDRAYLTTSSCSPTRCSLITGRYPHNTGAPELHTPLPGGQFVFPAALRKAGYYTVLSGKHHMGPAVNPAFDKVSGGRGPGKQGDWVRILEERPKDRPFFCWFASSDAHRGWTMNDEAPEYDPKDAVIPPYLIDGPKTRQDLAAYYHEVSRTDHHLGRLRAELERQGISRDTYVIYLSDNGRPFPRCKTRLYDSGVKTPLLICRPGTISPGRTDALASTIDLVPTILELAGVEVDERVQGVSLVPVLDDPSRSVRDYVFSEHNWHVFAAHERSVRYGPWLYIRNAFAHKRAMCVESGPRFPAGAELWAAHEAGKLSPAQTDVFLEPRPREELYHAEHDPHQLFNIAADAKYADVLAHLRRALDRWAEETGDTIPENPTPDRNAAGGQRKPKGEFPGAASDATRIDRPGPVRRADMAH